MPASIPPRRALLARRLRELRAAVFPSGSALARHLGWHQTRVSKLEQGTQRVTDDDLRQWAEAVGASEEQLDELYTLASAARVEYATFQQRYQRHGGAVAEQETTAQADAVSTRIAEFQPAMVPGIVQTAAYAREVLAHPCGPVASGVSSEEIDHVVGKRMERQHVLYHPRHKIQVVMGEAALFTRFGTTETLLGQLDRLLALTGLAEVEVGVVPFAVTMPIFPLTNFLLYDDHVLIESMTAQQRLDSPEEVAAYEEHFKQLREAAVMGDELATLLHRVMGCLRVRDTP
ncbi:helix-turn-helix domain-containing protein [Saccharomonospora iraqiensis]|uniref:helix-turn-helix domain-containing protein n=1 Tax=Saccharomonospora iraqiensis TaxID=52698 RepID=UPI00022E03A2|nr:helix-turn-helix transcriptional regulator [Saccharomonospora iraqiensis]